MEILAPREQRPGLVALVPGAVHHLYPRVYHREVTGEMRERV